MAIKYKIEGIKLDNTPVTIWDDFLKEDPVITKVSIDILPPFVSITNPTGGQVITLSDDVNVTGTAQDDFSVARVETSLDDGAWVEAANTSGGASVTSWLRSYLDIPNGTHTVKARAFDTAGLQSVEASTSFTMNIPPPPDIIPPTVTITTPVGGSTVTGDSTRTVTITGTAFDSESGVNRVEVGLDGMAMVVATGTTSWSRVFTGVPDGSRVITARAFDTAGNVSQIITSSFNMLAAVPPAVVIVITQPPKTSPPTIVGIAPPGTGFTLTVIGTTTGPVANVTVEARIPDQNPPVAGTVVNAVLNGSSWTATIIVPNGIGPLNTQYTRILAKTFYNGLQNGQAFNDVTYNVVTAGGVPPISPLSGATGCPVFAVSSYVVTVSKSGSTITAVGSDGVTKHTGAYTSSAGWASPALNAAISAANAKVGGGKVHVNAGEFLTYADVNMKNNVIIEGEGQIDPITKTTLTKLKCTKNQGKILVAGDRTNIGVKSLTLDGANIAVKVVDFHSCTGVFIHDSILERHNGFTPGVYIGEVTNCTVFNTISRNHLGKGDKLAVGGRNVRIISNDLYGQVHENGSITSGGIETGEVAYNYVHDTWTYAGISFENQSFKTYNVDIHHNTLKNLTMDGNTILFVNINSAESPPSNTFDKIWIHHNNITNVQGSGVQSREIPVGKTGKVISRLQIYDNTMTGVGYDGIRVGPVKTCLIDRNTITGTVPGRRESYGVRIQPVTAGNPVSDDVKIGSTAANANTVTNMSKGPTSISPGSTNVWINGVKKA